MQTLSRYANVYRNIPPSSLFQIADVILKTKRGWRVQPHHFTIIGMVVINVTLPPIFPIVSNHCNDLHNSCQIGKSTERFWRLGKEILIPLSPS